MLSRGVNKIISSLLSTKTFSGRYHGRRACTDFSKVKEKESYVVVTDDARTIVCWHPEKHPPYEFTKCLPYMEPEINEGDSVLKVQYRREEKYFYQLDGPTNKELAKMTYTDKFRWNPNRKFRKLDPNPPIDRDGL